MQPDQGDHLAYTLDALLARLQSATVSLSDRNVVNQCSEDDDTREYDGPVKNSLTFLFLKSMTQSIHDNSHSSNIVVDWPETASHTTEDSIWLSLPKWFPDIQWSVCTVNSMDRSLFRRIFDSTSDYKLEFVMQHGSALVVASTNTTTCRAFYSDQPRLISRYGRDMAKLDMTRPLIRVFRCAPRPCLKRGIQAVLAEPKHDNVFDVWIRHFDMSIGDNVGTFKHDLGAQVELVDMLTDLDMVINIRKSPGQRLSPDKCLVDEQKVTLFDSSKSCYESPPMKLQGKHVASADDRCEADTSWLELLELEPESPCFITPGSSSSDIGRQGATKIDAPICYDQLNSTPASVSTQGAEDAETIAHQFDDSVLNPMATELTERQKHLNKLNHLSPIDESPIQDDENYRGSLRYSSASPGNAVRLTPTSSPSEEYTKFPWHTPAPNTPAAKRDTANPAKLLLSELAAIVGGERRKLQGLSSPKPSSGKISSKLFGSATTTKVADENSLNL